MDLYHSSTGGSNRLYTQQRQTGGYRFTPNGQLTNGPSLYGNSSNLNLNPVFGSNIPSGLGSSGNQFNFPLRSNRIPGSPGGNSHRSNAILSPNRSLAGSSHNHKYGVYPSKPSSSIPAQHYNVPNCFPSNARSNSKVRKAHSQAITSREVQALSASLDLATLDDQIETQSSSPEPQYRIFKRGESYPQSGSGNTDDDNLVPNCSSSAMSPNKSAEQNSMISDDFGLEELPLPEVSDSAGVSASISSTATTSEVALSQMSTSQSSTAINNQQNSRTPVSLVAEIARFHGLTSEYRLVNETGPPHCPIFTVVLHLGGEMHEGIGPSIKKAQSAAATKALEQTSLPKPPPRNNYQARRTYQPWQGQIRSPHWSSLELAALAEEMNQPLHFVNHPITTIDHCRKVTPVTRVAVHIGDRIFSGDGNSFHAAKNLASMIALKALTKTRISPPLGTRRQSVIQGQSGPAVTTVTVDNEEEDESKSPISVVYEMALKRNMVISYETIKEIGPAHMKVFTVQCKVGVEFTTESDGFTKQQAKKLASELMITKLKEVPVPGESLKAFQRNLLNHKIVKRKAVAPVLKDIEKVSVSPISRLIQIAHLRKYKEPEFSVIVSSTTEESEMETQPSQGKVHLKPNKRNPRLKKPHFTIEVKVGPFVGKGEGPNKKAAKKAAADNALVLLGYPPSETKEPKTVESKPNTVNNSVTSCGTTSSSKLPPNLLKIVCGRSVVPGILVIQSKDGGEIEPKSENIDKFDTVVKKEEPGTSLGATVIDTVRDGVNKLSYLAQLLGVQVSYSDFPKKHEYLSVVSLGTSPPHVSHGIGPTLEDARNNAAMQVLNELSDKGIENDTPQKQDNTH